MNQSPDIFIRCTDCICVAIVMRGADGAARWPPSSVTGFSTPSAWTLVLFPDSVFPPLPILFSSVSFSLQLVSFCSNSLWQVCLSSNLCLYLCLPHSLSDLDITALITLPLRLLTLNSTLVTLSCFDMFSLQLYFVV